MKTTLRRLLAMACLVCLLAACGGKTAGSGRAKHTPRPDDAPAVETAQPTPEPAPTPNKDNYVPWGTDQVVEHIFFHPVIAYPQWGFHDCDSTESEKLGLDDWMLTVEEYNKILQCLYDKDYIIVNMNDVWSEYTDADGNTRMQRNQLLLPPGKKPMIISYDDVNYYEYMRQQGFTSKLVIGDDGELWAECTDPYTHETFLTQDLDAITILDKFIKAHPDFSLDGAKGCLALTGYQGILGYRTMTDRTVPADQQAAWEEFRQTERVAVAPIVQKLKDTGWYFGSHSFGHINLSRRSMESIQDDTQRWLNEVGTLVGETKLYFYPHGARPDGGDDVRQTGPQFRYLHDQGFRVFSSVGVESYSKCKSDISAVVCDRLHPDGKTLRWSRDRYLKFYDAKEIMDVSVRPDLGYDWSE